MPYNSQQSQSKYTEEDAFNYVRRSMKELVNKEDKVI